MLRSSLGRPLESESSERLYRQTSQDVRPWDQRFAKQLPDESPYAARAALAGKNARTLARDILAMTQAEFSAAFRNSPMKRAKLRGLKRSAAVVSAPRGAPSSRRAFAAVGARQVIVR